MFAFLKGRLAAVESSSVVLEVSGIGYRVHVPLSLLHRLPPAGEELMLHTHLVVREDDLQLYGFSSREELDFFVKLLNVTGVGPRVAQAVLSIFHPAELARAIAVEDLASLTRVPGVGKKTAGRIVLELKDKVAAGIGDPATVKETDGVEADAVAALESLGYSLPEARRAVKQAAGRFKERPQVSELVKTSLSILAGKP
ncbi:MAG: Holliday junction branch migration protein RuvA [Firmicutes bacterium]|nr:Holliday junction branch migration protein RuvA [Bacillota bacterium]